MTAIRKDSERNKALAALALQSPLDRLSTVVDHPLLIREGPGAHSIDGARFHAAAAAKVPCQLVAGARHVASEGIPVMRHGVPLTEL